MNAREQGFLLLTSHLGNPERRVLTPNQLKTLGQRMRSWGPPHEDRDLTPQDLRRLGFAEELAVRIVALLEEDDLLEYYLARAKRLDCQPITRLNPLYPAILRQRLGQEAPGCLWVRGDPTLLNAPAISLVGSRDPKPENRTFARAVGFQAAKQGLALVSGNARGSDREAQDTCLAAGGKVISIVADELIRQPERSGVLYVSEEDYDEPFSAPRALSRNRCIHTLGRMVFVSQCGNGKGGTWDGTLKNLRMGWSPVACFDDGSPAARQLEEMGAFLIGSEVLDDLKNLPQPDRELFDP